MGYGAVKVGNSQGRQGQSIGIAATALALVLGLAVSGGCASQRDQGAAASASDEPYPNLGDVPDRPVTMTEKQRQQLEQGLVADSQQRASSEDVIAFQAEPAEPLPAPVETGASASSRGDVIMPGAVTPPISANQVTPASPLTPASPSPAPTAAAARASPPTMPVPPADPVARATSVKVATILFEDGSSDLGDREKEIVREVYERYLASGRNVRVVGHSSSRARNMDPVRQRMVSFGISADRADAVALELQRLGVASDRITVVAAADDMPMYDEVMPSGEAGNRRTEIYLD